MKLECSRYSNLDDIGTSVVLCVILFGVCITLWKMVNVNRACPSEYIEYRVLA